MAIHRLLLLLSTLLLGLASISVNARPCKTILFISSSSASSSSFPSNHNPDLLFPNPRFVTFSYTRQPFRQITFSGDQAFLNRPFIIPSTLTPHKSTVDFDSSVGDSIRDRTLDILGVVSALLFGVGCGALAAAFMYLVWYICSPRSFLVGADDSDEEDDDDVTAAKKKLGYVAVPVDAVAVAAPVKQVE